MPILNLIQVAKTPLLIDLSVMWIECIGLIYMGCLQGIGIGSVILYIRLFIQWVCMVPLSYIMVVFFSGTLNQLWLLVAVLTIIKAIMMRQATYHYLKSKALQ